MAPAWSLPTTAFASDAKAPRVADWPLTEINTCSAGPWTSTPTSTAWAPGLRGTTGKTDVTAADQPERGGQPVVHVDLDLEVLLLLEVLGGVEAGGAGADHGHPQRVVGGAEGRSHRPPQGASGGGGGISLARAPRAATSGDQVRNRSCTGSRTRSRADPGAQGVATPDATTTGVPLPLPR